MATYYIGVLRTFDVGSYTATENLENRKAINTNDLDLQVKELRSKYQGHKRTRIHVNSENGIADIDVIDFCDCDACRAKQYQFCTHA